jgi:VIT1/CCC1 family predicted Fe2+/Mn2+ transporter
MNHQLKTGISFGLTSATITTLGLMIGLDSGTHSKLVVLGGVLTIAIADAFSDALGIHISEESEDKHTPKEIWESTIYTFIAKFLFALTFLIPLLLLDLSTAIMINVAYGLILLSLVSYSIGKSEKTKPWRVVFEHLFIAVVVIVIAHFVGDWIGTTFI